MKRPRPTLRALPAGVTPRKLTPGERELVRAAARIFLRRWRELQQPRERVGSAA